MLRIVLKFHDVVMAIVGIDEMALRASTHGTQVLFGPDHGKGRMITETARLSSGGFGCVALHEVFHATDIDVGEIDNRAPLLNQLLGVGQLPSQSAQDRQSHHWSAMYAGGAMYEDFGVWMFESLERELYAPLKEFTGLELKIVFCGVPEYVDAIRNAEVTVVKLDLHVDDVGYALVRHLHHFQFVPDTSANRDAVGHPRHVHTVPAYIMDLMQLSRELPCL